MIETPSVCNLLSQTPATSSHRIIKLGEKSLLEWSMTRHIVSESGLGMAWTSGLYILSKSFIPNNSEKCSAAISVQTCSSRKSHSCSLFGRHHDPSHNFGYPSFIMSANGQNPSCNLTKTESMKAQFGWWVSSPSNVLMSILQMILNRSGQFDIITCLTGSLSAIGLGCGKGFAVSEYPAVGPNSSSLTHWLSIDISWHALVSCPSHDITQAFCLCIPSQHIPPFHIWCKHVCTNTQRPVFHTSLDWTIDTGLYFTMWTLLHIVLWMILTDFSVHLGPLPPYWRCVTLWGIWTSWTGQATCC